MLGFSMTVNNASEALEVLRSEFAMRRHKLDMLLPMIKGETRKNLIKARIETLDEVTDILKNIVVKNGNAG